MLSIHPDARASFDKQALGILSQLSPVPPQGADRVEASEGWIRPHVSARLTEENVLSPAILYHEGPAGEPVSATFAAGGGAYTIAGEQYTTLKDLASKLSRAGGLKGVVDAGRVHEIIIDWIVRYIQSPPPESLTDFVLTAVEPEVGSYRIVIPIYNLFVQKPFRIADVTIDRVTSDDVANWYAEWRNENPTGQFERDIERWTKRLAGKAAASTVVVAARGQAALQGRRAIEAAVGMLRIFSKGTIYPLAVSHAAVLGKERVESDIHFLFRDDHFAGSASGFVGGHGRSWRLSNDWIDEIFGGGLGAMSELLALSRPTNYEASIIDSLLVYSRCGLESKVEAKLIWIFAALESQLLINSSEPVQDNIGHRLAYLLRTSVGDRREVISVVKKAYGMRSGFFHHGVEVSDLKTVQILMELAWTFFTGLALSWKDHDSKAQFIQSIDDRRLSGR